MGLRSACSTLRLRLLSSMKLLAQDKESAQLEQAVKRKFLECGIKIGGKGRKDIRIHDKRFYSKVHFNPATGIVESFIDGWWTPNNYRAFYYLLYSHWTQLTNGASIDTIPQVLPWMYQRFVRKSKNHTFNQIHNDILRAYA